MFGFSVILECNNQHNEQILFKMITRKSTHGQNDLVHRFIDFYDEIDHFGLGMVIFPSIIQSLNGKIDIRYV